MAHKTSIEWTDATWSPIRGCSRISPDCTNCYAERMAARGLPGMNSPTTGEPFAIMTPSGPRWTGKVELIESELDKPLRWWKPRRIFVNSISDTFHADVPDGRIDWLFAVMALCPQHTFLVLTKRADRMYEWAAGSRAARFTSRVTGGHWPLRNVWLGVSVEDQRRADERIPHLLATPAAVRFVSMEPMLGAVDLTCLQHDNLFEVNALTGDHGVYRPLRGRSDKKLDWVIVGGESGPGARPMHPDWARSIRNQCEAAGVPFFFKQWGAWQNGSGLKPANDRVLCNDGMLLGMDLAEADYGVRSNWRNLQPTVVSRVGKKEAGRLLDGRTWDEMPERLRTNLVQPESEATNHEESRG